MGAPLSRGRRAGLGFDVIVHIHDASAVVYACSSSRRLPDPLLASLLRSRFPPRLLTDMTLRWFGISACTANPEGLPPSLAQHGSRWRSSTSSSLPFQDAPRPEVPGSMDRTLWIQVRPGPSRPPKVLGPSCRCRTHVPTAVNTTVRCFTDTGSWLVASTGRTVVLTRPSSRFGIRRCWTNRLSMPEWARCLGHSILPARRG